MEPGAIASAVASVLVAWVKLSEKTFELKAVEAQAKAVLQTVTHVQNQLCSARKLRRQKSNLFTALEKSTFDDTFAYTDEAVTQVAALAERVRADMEVLGGKAGMNSRILFVLRDSPNIHVSLTKLSIAAQSLNTVIVSMNNRDGSSSVNQHYTGDHQPAFHGEPSKSPPTYTEVMFLSEARNRNLRKRASLNGSISSTNFPSSASLPLSTVSDNLSTVLNRVDTESREQGRTFVIPKGLGIAICEDEDVDGRGDDDDGDSDEDCGVAIPVAPAPTRPPPVPLLSAPPSVPLLRTPPPEAPQVLHRGRARTHGWMQQHSDNFVNQKRRGL